METVNPIERRIGLLRTQYLDFTQDEGARLLRWRFASDELRMLDVFAQVEAREGVTEDVIMVLQHPFTSPSGHGHALVAELAHRYDLLRECLADAGVSDATWRPPRSGARTPEDVHHLRATAASFHEHHQPLLRHLSLVLQPTTIADPRAYAAWLSEAMLAFDDPTLRLLVVEPTEAEWFATLVPAQWVREQRAELDMPGALHEINAAGGLDSPPGRFRDAYLKMGDAVAAHDMPLAQRHAEAALAVARSECWAHLVVATHYTMGAAFLGERQHPEAMRAFRDAEAEADAAGAEWSPQLVLQARLAQGSVCVSTQSWALGADTYGERALPVARSMQDGRMQIECLRMAGYCNEQRGGLDAAWDQCVAALGVGAAMTMVDRETTTLAYVGEAMLRLCSHRSFRGREPAVEAKMRSLLGPDWRPGGPVREPDVTQPSALETSPPPVTTVPVAIREPRP